MTDLLGRKYAPKTGDRVRVVLEGEVGQVGGLWFDIGTERGGNCIYADATHVVSIEKISDPLPSTPGSVISFVGSLDSKYVRLPDGGWYSIRRGSIAATSDFIVEDYEVLFDAGKAS